MQSGAPPRNPEESGTPRHKPNREGFELSHADARAAVVAVLHAAEGDGCEDDEGPPTLSRSFSEI